MLPPTYFLKFPTKVLLSLLKTQSTNLTKDFLDKRLICVFDYNGICDHFIQGVFLLFRPKNDCAKCQPLRERKNVKVPEKHPLYDILFFGTKLVPLKKDFRQSKNHNKVSAQKALGLVPP